MKQQALKFCVDCKHYFDVFPYPAKCISPKQVDLVTGASNLLCGGLRNSTASGDCGREARFFEPKEKK